VHQPTAIPQLIFLKVVRALLEENMKKKPPINSASEGASNSHVWCGTDLNI